MKTIKFMYAGEERYINYDGKCFMPCIQAYREKDGVKSLELVTQAYFTKIGGAIHYIIKNQIADKKEELSLLQLVTRFEVAVKELRSIKEEDLF